RLRQHSRSERARRGRRVREGGPRRGRVPRPLRGTEGVMSETVDAPPAETPKHSFLERMLDGIERLGNKMPDPAILFLILCGVVIVLSQVLYWFDIKATYEVVKPPPAPATETYYGGSIEPTYVGPSVNEPAKLYHVTTETT